MTLPQLSLELLLMIAHQLLDDCAADDDDGISLDALKSFRQVNRTLYHCIKPIFWREALKREHTTERVLTSLIRTNDLARLEFFLELGIDIETCLPKFGAYTNQGFYEVPSPLIAAVNLDNVPFARLFLENGAKVETAMRYARSAEMVQLFLDFHADPEKKGPDNQTPLHWYAASRLSIAAMQAVLQCGVKVDPVTVSIRWGRHATPLHIAAQRGNVEAMKLLLAFGADARKKSRDGSTALHHAAKAGEIEAVKILVERWPGAIKAKDEDLQTPLHRAAEAGSTKVVKFLVGCWREGIRVEDRNGNTPLHCAARNEHIKAVRSLVKLWPEGMMAENKRSDTPLHLAGQRERIEMVRVLVDYWPVDIRVEDRQGNTLLDCATEHGNIGTLLFLVERWLMLSG
jgi:ankyrin repeat protein